MKWFIALFAVCSFSAFAQEQPSAVTHREIVKVQNIEKCMADIEHEFEMRRAKTLTQLTEADGEIIKRYRFRQIDFAKDFHADTNGVKFVIRFDISMCALTKLERDIIVAHEWGHAVSFIRYPQLLDHYNTNIHMHSKEVYERLANNYASEIFPNDKVNEALTFMDGLCKKDNPYQCQRVVAWRQNLGRNN